MSKAHISKSFLTLNQDVPKSPKLSLNGINDTYRLRMDSCHKINISRIGRYKPKPNDLTGLRPHSGNTSYSEPGLLSQERFPTNKPLMPRADPYYSQLNSKLNR